MFDFTIPVAFFVLVGFVFWVGITGWQRTRRLKAIVDFNTRLLDKLGSAKDFGDFLQTSAGSTFAESFATEAPATSPQQRILRATQAGIILLSVGIGLLLLNRLVAFRDVEPREAFAVIGGVVLSLGIGYLVSAAVSYRLAAMLGVLDRPHTREHKAELT